MPYRGEAVADSLVDTAHEIGERVRSTGSDIAAAAQERPYTSMAIAGGLAFAVGALWMLGRQRPQSRLDALLARLPELPDGRSMLPRGWRS